MRLHIVSVGLAAALVAGAPLLAGCRGGAARDPAAKLDLAAGKSHVLKGRLLEGAECPLLETADGHRLSLGGDLRGFRPGDRVCVRGRLAEASICMAGEATLAIEAIGPEAECP